MAGFVWLGWIQVSQNCLGVCFFLADGLQGPGSSTRKRGQVFGWVLVWIWAGSTLVSCLVLVKPCTECVGWLLPLHYIICIFGDSPSDHSPSVSLAVALHLGRGSPSRGLCWTPIACLTSGPQHCCLLFMHQVKCMWVSLQRQPQPDTKT